MARGLGRGLEELFGVEEESVQEVEIKQIRPNPYQPRKKLRSRCNRGVKGFYIAIWRTSANYC